MAGKRKPEEMTEEEIAEAEGEPLPDREAMSVIRGPVEYPLPDDVYPIPDPREPGPTPLEERQPPV
jgi:hypothetical protein